MIHYSIWFRLRDNLDESDSLAIVRDFLAGLRSSGEITGFQMLKNRGAGGKTTRLPFQALIEFRDNDQFSAAFSTQATRGIHAGLHGQVMSLVDQFQIEVFEQIPDQNAALAAEDSHQFACEI